MRILRFYEASVLTIGFMAPSRLAIMACSSAVGTGLSSNDRSSFPAKKANLSKRAAIYATAIVEIPPKFVGWA